MMKKSVFLAGMLMLSGNIVFGYFQQEVNYKINVKLDDLDHFLQAYEEIEYTNNSEQTLDFIWFHLWPNAYKNHQTALARQLEHYGNTKFHFSEPEERGYIDSLDFKVNGSKATLKYHQYHEDVAKLVLPEPLKPGEKITITTPFRVKIPKGVFSRLGHIEQQYQVTQWYPKPAVFDETGWHEMPYLNQGEFYSEYGSFEVKITLPENYVVGATGDLQEASEIFFLDSMARKTENIQEYATDNDFPESSPTLKTITYKQQNVHDFAWFADKRYHVLKSEVELPHSGRTVDTWVMFTNRHASLWKDATEYMDDAVYYYSLWNGDYPYNQATAVDGALSAGGGMEYPNVTVIGSAGNALGLEQVIMHEVGHNWFYGILGSNERTHPWMDEGLNTFNEIRYMLTKYPDQNFVGATDNNMLKFAGIDKYDHLDILKLGYLYSARMGRDQPIATKSTDLTQINYGVITYFKTGAVFYYLMKYYGEERFTKAMQRYYEDWKFKHPQPEDLKASLEESLGENLDWFFEQVINSTDHIDYSIGRSREAENGKEVLVKNKGEIEAPVFLSSKNGTQKRIDKKVEGFTGKKWIPVADSLDDVFVNTKFLPDLYPTNNVRCLDRPFRFKFLTSAENPFYSQVYYVPVIGWNNYDKLMGGVALHNIGLPHKRFEYLVMPMLSAKVFDHPSYTGSVELQYNLLPDNHFERIKIRPTYRSYSIPSFNAVEGGKFRAIDSRVTFMLNQKRAGAVSSNFYIHPQYIEEDNSILDPIPAGSLAETAYTASQNFYLRGGYEYSFDHTVNEYDALIEAEYHQDFAKVQFEGNYQYLYHTRGYLSLRLFGGAFISNSSGDPRYNFRMDGQSGMRDYHYDEVMLDRGQSDPVFGQQFIENHGGFKVPTGIGQSNNWISSLNLKVKAPVKFPVGIFADAGVYPGVNQNVTGLYDAGIYIPLLRNVFAIYAPLIYSNNIDQSLSATGTGFAERIRFTLSLSKLNPIDIREQVGF